ncbi:hypothetical protein L2E82_51188 [Cichorium intybus]|nr:hypothetical protein L2E82_51185 [Cichorium intybus]KAI3679648.1 hypothetical protein L2E82_51188 [Cichorium intybus]
MWVDCSPFSLAWILRLLHHRCFLCLHSRFVLFIHIVSSLRPHRHHPLLASLKALMPSLSLIGVAMKLGFDSTASGGVPKEYFLGLLETTVQYTQKVSSTMRAAVKVGLNDGQMDDSAKNMAGDLIVIHGFGHEMAFESFICIINRENWFIELEPDLESAKLQKDGKLRFT